jgi:hypothetical protein
MYARLWIYVFPAPELEEVPGAGSVHPAPLHASEIVMPRVLLGSVHVSLSYFFQPFAGKEAVIRLVMVCFITASAKAAGIRNDSTLLAL